MKVLLDTAGYTALRNGVPRVVEIVSEAEGIVFSTLVAGELLYGFQAGTRREENERHLRGFMTDPEVTVVDVTMTTAERYARIAAGLRKKGRLIPSNDMWIAAHAMETGATLVSSDAHFGHVDGLAWVDPGA
ncbi:MAG: type II toxin-antitoxin system VapC family toxin [Planctomycetales bacterium]|nr:type II toxin-antitoxin system VapC family toxin [Planctomycetales bacterium]